MSSRLRFLLPLAALWLVPSVRANNLAYVKCAANQDRVWVYESLSSFDVEAKLRCGAPVEILSRIKGYVKVRSENGVEGYVPEAALPDLPALPDEAKQPLGTAASHSLVAAHNSAANGGSAAASVTPNSSISAEKAVKPEQRLAAPAQAVVKLSAPAQPATTVPAKASASAPAKKPTPSAPANVSAKVSGSRVHTKSATPAPKKPTAAAANPGARAGTAAPNVPPAPVVAPARPWVESVSASARDSAAIVPATAMPPAKLDEDLDEYPDTQPENESADPACRVFFAAYGLTPSQYKWMAENRRKQFSGICPAPDVVHVDYVVLFTHDSDSYTYAMPVPVHTDRSGFSDFSPLMTADTALVASSELEKARYEFVWVFRVTRGAFDPAKFSPRRKPQFTTYAKGARASSRAIEDAFAFVQNQGMTR